MRRLFSRFGLAVVPLSALALVAGLVAPAAPVVTASSRPIPKVVIIVGPAGDATDHYRTAGAAAASVARGFDADVVEVVSPNATWPVACKALQGASIVVYLGHGNGWPSRYRPNLYPPSQNGLGLNPVAGVDDVAHQYFGESYLEADVRLAPNAVVVLSHLCYASGNSEPGLPEGTLDVARQRVDNFAAGWIAAGARAVVAEAYLDPAYYVRSLLSGHGSVASAWRRSPTFNDNVLSFASARRPGFVDLLDPESASGSGFDRSLVIRGAVPASQVVGSGHGTPNGGGSSGDIAVPPPAPPQTLASVGARVDSPTLAGLPVAGTKRSLTLPISLPSGAPSSLVDGLRMSVRWDPLDVPVPVTSGGATPPTTVASAVSGSPAPSPNASAALAPNGSPSSNPAGSTSASPSPDPSSSVDPFALVVPEVPGDVVDPVRATHTKAGWRIPAALPSNPGLYLLTIGLHGPEGVALDEASQSLVPRLLVRIVGPRSATVVAPASVEVAAGASFELPVHVRNSGSGAWAVPQLVAVRPTAVLERLGPVRVSAHWVPLGPADGAPTDGAFSLDREVRSGQQFEAPIALDAPVDAGAWLLVLDVETPETPSLVAAGSPATVVRVTVTPAAPTDVGPPRD